MRNWLISFITAFAVTACAGNSVVKEQFERCGMLAAEPTPADWQTGSVWTFVTTHRDGTKETLTFRVSDAVAETCASGDWRALELLEGKLVSLAGVQSTPAALTEGRNLTISLTSNWCDINNDLKGELLGDTFVGQHTSGGMTGSTLVGKVQGRRVK